MLPTRNPKRKLLQERNPRQKRNAAAFASAVLSGNNLKRPRLSQKHESVLTRGSPSASSEAKEAEITLEDNGTSTSQNRQMTPIFGPTPAAQSTSHEAPNIDSTPGQSTCNQA